MVSADGLMLGLNAAIDHALCTVFPPTENAQHPVGPLIQTTESQLNNLLTAVLRV